MRYWPIVLAATLVACGGDGSSSPPTQTLEDTTPPVITLTGANPQIIEAGEAYVELGATATDNRDGNVSGSIVIDASDVDTAVPGEYPVTYDVSDASGNAATTVTRMVICQDTKAPVITLTGANPQTLSQGDAYVELGATAMDTVDGDLTAMLVIDASAVDTATVGDYAVTYDVSDAAGNAAVTGNRIVRVVLAVPAVPTVSVAADIKQLIFSWDAVPYADYYRLLENPDGGSGFTQVGEDIPTGTTSVTIPVAVHLMDWLNAEYVVEACNSAGCNSSAWVNAAHLMLDSIGYFKASNTAEDYFGYSIALSGDGTTLAVGALSEDSNATGVNGDQNDNSSSGAGAVYVFRNDGTEWYQEAYIKASNTESGDGFGDSIALDRSGNTLAAGAPYERSAATGVNGDENDNSEFDSGAVYVFRHDGTAWYQEAYVKDSDSTRNSEFGWSVSLSGDGNRLAVGAKGEAYDSVPGAVYVFAFDGLDWSEQANIETPDEAEIYDFGWDVTLSADANTLAVGVIGDYSTTGGGAVYLYRFDGADWQRGARLAPQNGGASDNFGACVSLSSDGNVLLVGAPGEDSNAIGIDGDQADDSSPWAGAAYVLRYDGRDWREDAYLKASNTEPTNDPGELGDIYGRSCDLSSDGNTVVVGANLEDSVATGVNGYQNDNSAQNSGAAYIYRYEHGGWVQLAYVKAPNSEAGDYFGYSIAVSDNGRAIAISATSENSSATGVSGDQSDNSVEHAGAVYLY